MFRFSIFIGVAFGVIFNSIALLAITNNFYTPTGFPELSPIEKPQMACERYNSEGHPVLGFFLSKDTKNHFRVWQANSVQDKEGLRLDIVKVLAARCPGCYQVTAAFGQPGNGVLLTLDISKMNVSFGPNSSPGLKVTMNPYPPIEDGEDAEPVVWNDFKCQNLDSKHKRAKGL